MTRDKVVGFYMVPTPEQRRRWDMTTSDARHVTVRRGEGVFTDYHTPWRMMVAGAVTADVLCDGLDSEGEQQ